ncbi:MAG: FG-GAP-like repeat-containing protein [Bacteroidota bacterium]
MRLLLPLLLAALASGAVAQPLTSIYSARSGASQNDGFFGAVLAPLPDITGDGVGDWVSGAPQETQQLGRAYLHSGATGTAIRTLVAPTGEAGGFFGASVAHAGDMDGDGTADVIVSGYLTVAGDDNAGQAFVFSGATGDVLLTLTSPASQANGFFGFNVAGPGDLDGDGTPDLIVGATDEDIERGGQTVVDHGAVYAFSGTDGSLLWRSTIPPPEAGTFYGRVTAVGDLTGDGVADLLAGAVLADNAGGIESGMAYAIDGASGALVYELPPGGNAQGNGFFGFTLAGLGDLDGDGVPELAVGAPFEGVGGTSIRDGTVTFFRGGDGSAIGTYALDTRQGERRFGWAVAPAGDLDGDGTTEIAISSIFQFNRFHDYPPPLTDPFSGGVFVYSGADIGDAEVVELAEVYPSLPVFPTNFRWSFGSALASLDDVDGGGLPDLAIGAPNQGADIGLVAVISGERMLAISDVNVEAEAEVAVSDDSVVDFPETGLDLALDGVTAGRPAAAPEASPAPSTGALRRIGVASGARGEARRGTTNLRVQRFSSAPLDLRGIAEANVSAYRWIVATTGTLRWTDGEIRFDPAEIPSSGITDPTDVTVYFRRSLGAGEFSALPTTVDAGTGEIVATGFTSTGAFTGEFALASDSNPLPSEGGPDGGATLALFPNPASGAATVRLSLPTPEAVRVTVVDALGRTVAVVHDGPLAAGETELRAELSTLRAGVYLVRASGAAGALTQRLTVLR